MNEHLLTTLLHQIESATLDFKRDQYAFYGADKDAQSELLKDILAFANAWKTSDAFILIGVDEISGQKADVVGVTEHLKDNDLQQFVNAKTNRPVSFLCGTFETLGGQHIDYVRIDAAQNRPLFLTRNFGRLTKDVVYIRQGSSTKIANPQEIADMGADQAASKVEPAQLDLQFADPETRTLIGHELPLTSYLLVDDTLPATSPRSSDGTLSAGIQASLAQLSSSVVRMNQPDPDELFDYYCEVVALRPASLCLSNLGVVPVNNVSIEIEIPRLDVLTVIDRWDYPRRPRTYMELSLPHVPVQSDVRVDVHKDSAIARLDVKNLQPKAASWFDPDILFKSTAPVRVALKARIFADELREPVEIPLTLEIKTEERAYSELLRSLNSSDEGNDDGR